MLTGARMASLIFLALVAALIAELKFIKRSGDVADVNPTQETALANIDSGAPAFALNEPESFAEISERPLFVAGRRPPENLTPAQKPPNQAKQAPNRASDFVLSAIVRERGRWIALIGTRRNSEPVQVEVGSVVAGWEVEQIEIEGIVLRQGERTTQLSLRGY